MSVNSIDSDQYVDGSIDTAHIANLQITTALIAADAVDGTKLADNAVDSEHYTDGSIDTAHINDLNVTTAKIAADAITGAKIADDAIDSEHYAAGSVDTAHIANLQITTALIAADAIDGTKLADNAVDSEHYTDGSIDTAHIANDQITAALMADNSIDSDMYVDGSIDLAHMSSQSVDEDNLHISNSPTNGYALTAQSGNAGGLTWADISTSTATIKAAFPGIDDTSSSNDDCLTITDNEIVINEDGDNQDFRVESDDQANFFFCDASANIAGFSLHDRPDLGFIHITTASSGVSSVDAAGDEFIIEGSGHTGMSIFSGTTSTGGIYFGDSGDNNIGGIRYDHSDNDMYFTVEASDIARFSGGKGMRVGDAGTVDTSLQVVGSDDDSTGSLRLNSNARINMSNAVDRDILIFGNSAGSVRGKISIDVDGGVTYHTSSDYRLKENVVDLTDAITRLKTLKPRRFKWLNRPETIDGFLAHEVTAVPEAVSGTKDGMADKLRVVLDKDGNFLAEGVQDGNHEKGIAIGEYPSDSTYHATKEYPDYQQMDNSKLVPLLTASLQEAITKIETLETEMTALKARVTTLEG